MNDVVKISVTETYKVSVECPPVYDLDVISDVETIVRTQKSYCLWISDPVEITNQKTLLELSKVLAPVSDTYLLPRDRVELTPHTDRFDSDKTDTVVDILHADLPDRDFVVETTHRGLTQFGI